MDNTRGVLTSLRFRLIGVLVLLPVLVAAVLTVVAVRLFQKDKELSVFDLSAQTVDLVARNLSVKLEGLRGRADLSRSALQPFLSLSRQEAAHVPQKLGVFRIDNVSDKKWPRLRIASRTSLGPLTMEVRPESLLDLRGYQGPAELMVVNDRGEVLVHPDQARIKARTKLGPLLGQLGVFASSGPRLGTREVEVNGEPTLVAHARVGSSVAVIQSIAKDKVLAATTPMVSTAILVSVITVLVAVALGLLLGQSIIRPLRLMVQQTEAIARGEFGVSMLLDMEDEMSSLMGSLNDMSASLKRRDDELQQVQRQLLQAERLNTASHMMTAIVGELSEPLEICLSLASQTLRKVPEHKEITTLQEEIVRQANRASNILQNLRRIGSRRESEPRIIEADLALADAVVSARPVLEKTGLRVQSKPGSSAEILVRPDQLHNALLDIFLFLAQRAQPNSIINIRAQRSEGTHDAFDTKSEAAPRPMVTIDMHFAGMLVSEEERERLLHPFSASTSGEGTLVLAVASMVLHEEEGKLDLLPTSTGNILRLYLPSP